MRGFQDFHHSETSPLCPHQITTLSQKDLWGIAKRVVIERDLVGGVSLLARQEPLSVGSPGTKAPPNVHCGDKE